MSWNHRDRVFAMGVALQPTPGQFVLPDSVTGLIGVSQPNNGREAISAPDPTQTGTIWDAPRVFLGTTGTGGGTIPLRGYGGATPPLANAFVMGIIMQACGFAEIRRQTATAEIAVGAGSTTSTIVLDNSESSIDDMLLGLPIQNAAFGSGFRQTTLIADYIGASRTALLAETLAAAPTGAYIMPAGLTYVLGTNSVAPPLFSVSIWRDKVRYDYRDCVITSWGLDVPVSSENNTVFPSLDFAMKGVPMPRVDVASTPPLPAAIRNVPVPPARGGKFFLDKIKLGHVGLKANIALTTGAASNQNQDRGQDGYDIQSGTRTIDLTLNQMNVSDFDLDGRVDNQLRVSALSTWGLGTGNNMGLVIPEMVLDPQNPGNNNGYVTLAGNSFPTALDKSIALSFW